MTDVEMVRRAGALAESAQADSQAAEQVLSQGLAMSLASEIAGSRYQVRAGRAVATMGRRSADALQRASSLAVSYLERRAGGDGPIDAAARTLVEGGQDVNGIFEDVYAVEATRATISGAGLPPVLASALAEFDTRLGPWLERVKDFESLRGVAQTVLGVSRPSSYLLLLADNSELRPGGGFIGSFATFGFDGGRLQSPRVADIYTLDVSRQTRSDWARGGGHYIEPPPPLRRLLKDDGLMLRDASWSPFWIDDARQAEDLFQVESGQRVDGVVQIDPAAISIVLDMTGPVAVPGYSQPVDSANVLPATLENTRTSRNGENRKAFLDVLATALLERLSALPPERWLDLGKALTRAGDERHLFAYANDPALEALVERGSLSGRMGAPENDGLRVIYGNVGGNKTDYWLRRSMQLEVDSRTGTHHLEVDLMNQSPGLPGGYYFAYVRFYLPPSATEVTAAGFWGSLDDLGPDHGWRVLGGYVKVLKGKSGRLTLAYRVPPGVGKYRLDVVKQPGAAADPIEVRVAAPPGVQVPQGAVRQGDTLMWKSALYGDLSLSLD